MQEHRARYNAAKTRLFRDGVFKRLEAENRAMEAQERATEAQHAGSGDDSEVEGDMPDLEDV